MVYPTIDTENFWTPLLLSLLKISNFIIQGVQTMSKQTSAVFYQLILGISENRSKERHFSTSGYEIQIKSWNKRNTNFGRTH